ncbi:MAG: hypothetical protein H9855_03390 [Candidatus Acinetobacter avistercoris]|nr:hypothetical protein [Candidatus Acinetobacter avistercoris]
MVIECDYDGYHVKRVFNATSRQCTSVSYDIKRKNEWQYNMIEDHEGLNWIKSSLLNLGYKIDWDAFNFLLNKKQLSWGY